jgi:hypothetical protein
MSVGVMKDYKLKLGSYAPHWVFCVRCFVYYKSKARAKESI